MTRAEEFVRRHPLIFGPLAALAIWTGIGVGFGIAVGIRGAWQDRRHTFRPYEQFGDRR